MKRANFKWIYRSKPDKSTALYYPYPSRWQRLLTAIKTATLTISFEYKTGVSYYRLPQARCSTLIVDKVIYSKNGVRLELVKDADFIFDAATQDIYLHENYDCNCVFVEYMNVGY